MTKNNLVASMLAIVLGARTGVAQVGYDPAHSPYHDVQRGIVVRLVGGYVAGGRGKIPIAPSDGPTGGVRLDYMASSFFTLTAGVAYAQTDVFYFNPADSAPQRRGPVNNDFVVADAGLLASLSGGKTFHGFQPYAGATVGLVFGSANGLDSSGYSFGTRFAVIPELGVRWYPARRLSFALASRFLLYKLQYPLSYRPKLLAVTEPLKQWTTHAWATVGLGWTF